MKGLALLALLLIPSLSRADVQWSGVNLEYKDLAFVSGYVSASLYDMSDKDNSSNNPHCVMWKMGLGLSAGLAVAIGHANYSNSTIAFSDVVFGGLGGLTCVVVHF